jgi:uncharacterized protein YaaR (DUF327 family)
MERIDFHGGFFSVPSKPNENKKSRGKAKTAQRFSEFFAPRTEEGEEALCAKLSGRADEAEIGKALDEVHIRGDKLKKSPSLDTIREYKNAAGHFLRLIVAASYEVEESLHTRPRDCQEQRNVRILVINEKLERLAAQIMRSQKDELEILRRVDEIYGLLVDLRR